MSSLWCLPARGMHPSRGMRLTAGMQRGCTMTEAWSVDLACLSHVQPHNHYEMSQTMIIHGSSFGIWLTARSRVMLSVSQVTAWMSFSSILCQAHQVGSRMTNALILTAGNSVGSITEAWSVDSTLLHPYNTVQTHLKRRNGNTSGLMNQSTSKAPTNSSCNATAHFVDECNKTRSGFAYVESAALVFVAPAVALASIKNSSSTNRSSHLSGLSGFHLHFPASLREEATSGSAQARLGDTSCESTVWASDTRITCLFTTRRMTTRSASLTLGVRIVGSISQSFTMDDPTLQGNFSCYVALAFNQTTRRGFLMGAIGPHTTAHTAGSRLFCSAADATAWGSSTSISCKLISSKPSSTGKFMVTLGAAPASLSELLTLDGPLLRTAGNMHNHPASLITLSGTRLGCSSSSIQMRMAVTGAEATMWVSSSTLLARAPMAMPGSLHALLSAGGGRGQGTQSQALSMDAVAHLIVSANTLGSQQVLLHLVSQSSLFLLL
jgi:hypothetical protein